MKTSAFKSLYVWYLRLQIFRFRFRFSDFYYYALFTKYNKINIYRNYMKYKKKEISSLEKKNKN